jgi:hypothetical protein
VLSLPEGDIIFSQGTKSELAVVLDVFSQRIVGWDVEPSPFS